MTVVAKGAAIHASTILRPDRASFQVAPGPNSASLELFYEPVSPDPRTTISGKLVKPSAFSGEIRLSRAGGDWDTGWVPLRNGAFVCEVFLNDREACEFQLSLRDMTGNLWSVTPSAITIRNGIAAAKPVAPYDYGVALEDGSMGLVVKQGSCVPVAHTASFRSAKTVPAGSNEELVVHFMEGASRAAEDNAKVGEVRISGQDLRRTLREDETVEVRIHIDESRLVKARVSIPLHDLDYEVKFKSMIESPPLDDLESSMDEVRDSLTWVQDEVVTEDEAALLSCLGRLEQLEAELDRVRAGENGESERVAQKIAAIRADMRPLKSKYGLQAKYRDVLGSIDRAESIARDADDSLGAAIAGDLRKDAERWFHRADEKQLEAVQERAREIFWKHYRQTQECWIDWVRYLRDQRRFATDPGNYDEFVKRASDCLQRGDYEGVRVNCLQASEYLPDSEEKESRIADAGLRKQ